ELGGPGDLEEDVLHHVTAEGLRHRQCLAAEQYVLETPAWCTQHRRIAHLSGQCHESMPHTTTGRIPGRPALARAGVRRMPIGAQCTAVGPGIGDGIDD